MQIIRNFFTKYQISILILSNILILITICLVLYGWYYLYTSNLTSHKFFGIDDDSESSEIEEKTSQKITLEDKKALLEKLEGNPDNVSIEDKRKLLSTLQSSE